MPTKRNITTTVFLAIWVTLMVSLVGPTLNYIEFYRATLVLKVLSVTVVFGQNKTNITLVFALQENSSYNGLKLREISNLLHFEANGEPVLLWSDVTSYRQQPVPLIPYIDETFQFLIELNKDSELATFFQEYYEANQGSIKWMLKCGAVLMTFAGNTNVELEAFYFSHARP